MWFFLFGLSGRLSRASFCLYAAIAFGLLLVMIGALYLYELCAGNYENGGPTPWPSTPLGIAGAALWFLALSLILVCGLAVGAKRLHDRNKTAWWLVVFVVLPNALSSFAEIVRVKFPEDFAVLPLLLNGVALAILGWAFVELACLRGTPGPNRFGSDPLMHDA